LNAFLNRTGGVARVVKYLRVGLGTALCLMGVTVSIAHAKPLDAADIFLTVDPDLPFKEAHWNLQCDTAQQSAPKLKSDRVTGKAFRSGEDVQKFGRTESPSDKDVKVLLFQAQADSVQYGGSPRCEIRFGQEKYHLPRNKNLWHAFSVWLDDWSQADDSMLIMQWFHGVNNAKLNPPLGVVVTRDRIYATLRHSDAEEMTRRDQVEARVFDERSSSLYGRWLQVIIQAKISPQESDGGYFKAWIDGKQVADYRGPIGYALPRAGEEVTHGIYPLTKGKVPFDLRFPVRKMYMRKAVVVLDPDSKYTMNDLSEALR
jgi:Polysaccharide lyase